MNSKAWVAEDAESGEWMIGIGRWSGWSVDLGRGHAVANWRFAATLRDDGQASWAGIADPSTRDLREFQLPFRGETVAVRADPSGGRLFVHGGEDGRDFGALAIDTQSGAVQTMIEGGDLGPSEQRNFLLWSATGNTLVSTICDLEQCQADLIDPATLETRRLPGTLAVVAVTDGYLLGHAAAGADWVVFDLARDAASVLPIDPQAQVSALIPIDNRRVVLDELKKGSYVISLADLEDRSLREITTLAADPDSELRLLRWPLGDPRWAALSPGGSISDGLAENGTLPTIRVLEVDSGDILPIEYLLAP